MPCLMIPWMIWTVLGILLTLASCVAQIVAAANTAAPAWFFASIIIGMIFFISVLSGHSNLGA
jgi:hypothetical protein